MKKRTLILALGALTLLASCRKETPRSPLDLELEAALTSASDGMGRTHYRLPLPGEYDQIPQDPRNPITKAKADLGRLLFHDSGLALGALHTDHLGTYSCASCHFAAAGFQAGRHQGIGDGGLGFGINGEARDRDPDYAGSELDVQPVRSPSILNAAYQEAMIWNGQFGALGVNEGTEAAWTPGTPKEVNHLGFEGLEIQAIAGQGVHRQIIDPAFITSTSYKGLFDLVFGDLPVEERYTAVTAGLAMAAYERTVLADQAPFQRWIRGNDQAMTENEKRGAILFFSKAGCYTCHNGPSLANMEFHAMGMDDLHNCPEPTFRSGPQESANLGRGGFTGNPAEYYQFKTPQLYNLRDSPFYGHGSSLRSIREVLRYKNLGVPQRTDIPAAQLSPHFKPLGLTEQELDQLEAFISNALYDPNLARYQPEHLPSGTCIPNNDPVSRVELGCE